MRHNFRFGSGDVENPGSGRVFLGDRFGHTQRTYPEGPTDSVLVLCVRVLVRRWEDCRDGQGGAAQFDSFGKCGNDLDSPALVRIIFPALLVQYLPASSMIPRAQHRPAPTCVTWIVGGTLRSNSKAAAQWRDAKCALFQTTAAMCSCRHQVYQIYQHDESTALYISAASGTACKVKPRLTASEQPNAGS